MTLNNLKKKIQNYPRLRPNRFKILVAASSLILILLISTVIAVIMQDDSKQPVTSDNTPIAQIAQIAITKDGFVPAKLVVKKGTKIIWTNNDESMHQIQANPHPAGESLPGLKSEILNNTQTYEYTADTAGTFGYHDYINPTTNGTIEVTE